MLRRRAGQVGKGGPSRRPQRQDLDAPVPALSRRSRNRLRSSAATARDTLVLWMPARREISRADIGP
jgi:hypothetical protein